MSDTEKGIWITGGCCVCLYIIATGVIASVLVSFLNNTSTNFLLDSAQSVNTISSMMAIGPITDIVVGSNCSKPSSEVLLFSFPGMSNGCSCNGVIKSGSDCDSTCTSLDSFSSRNLYLWKSAASFCITRNSQVQYSGTNCSTGFQRCPDGYTCVPTAESCPINNLTFIASNAGLPNGSKLLEIGQLNIALAHTVNGSLNTPLTNIVAQPSGTPCVANGRWPIRNQSSQYLLANLKQTGCGKYGSDNNQSKSIDQQTEASFYQVNQGLFDSLSAQYPQYGSMLQAEPFYLYARSVPKLMNPDCARVNFTTLNKVTNDLEAMNTTIGILASIALGLILLIFICPAFCCCYMVGTGTGEFYLFLIAMAIPMCLSLLYTYAYGGLSFYYSSKYNEKVDLLVQFRNLACFGQTNWELALTDFTDPQNINEYRKCFTWPQYLMIFCTILAVSACSAPFLCNRQRVDSLRQPPATWMRNSFMGPANPPAGSGATADRPPVAQDPAKDVPMYVDKHIKESRA